jgi:hypothetical protein
MSHTGISSSPGGEQGIAWSILPGQGFPGQAAAEPARTARPQARQDPDVSCHQRMTLYETKVGVGLLLAEQRERIDNERVVRERRKRCLVRGHPAVAIGRRQGTRKCHVKAKLL